MSEPLSSRCVAKECRKVWHRGPLRKPGFHYGLSDSFLHQGFVNVMAPLFLSPGVHPSVFLGKDPLPTPVFRRIRVLPAERMWKLHDQLSILSRADPNRS